MDKYPSIKPEELLQTANTLHEIMKKGEETLPSYNKFLDGIVDSAGLDGSAIAYFDGKKLMITESLPFRILTKGLQQFF